MVVDLMIIGSQKSATTTLFDILQTSNKVNGSSEKEPDFFSKNNWRSGLEKYHSLFSGENNGLKLEASTQYTFYPHIENKNIVKDIYEYNPSMKFIYIIRNPIDRIISAYMHSYQSCLVSGTIDEIILENKYFIDVTRYAEQIKPYIEMFGRKQILILDFSDVVSNIDKTISEIEFFLDINLGIDSELTKTHSNKSLNTSRIKNDFHPITNSLKKISKHFPPKVQSFGKKIIYSIPFLHGPKFSKKPTISPDTLNYLKQELGAQRMKMEKITGRSLSHWDNL